MNAGSSVYRMFARAGLLLAALTSALCAQPVLPPTITKTFQPSLILVNGTSTLSITVSNPNTTTSLTNVSFTDTLPTGVTFTGFPGSGAFSATCAGTHNGPIGTSSININLQEITASTTPLPANGSCTFSVLVTSATPGVYSNTTSNVTSDQGTGLSASATLVVVPIIVNQQGTGVEDAFQITYISQLNNADSVINISNAGTVAGTTSLDGVGVAAGNLCVNIYVYAPDQQQVACCSCLVTHNELIYLNAGGPTESTSTSWGIPTSEGGNGVPGFLWNTTYGPGRYPFNSAVVKLVATNANGPNGCFNAPFVAGSSTPANITAARITAADLAPGMSVWTTHSHPNNGPTTAGPGGTTLLPVNVTETEGQYKGLSFGELTGLTTLCNTIAQNSSGAGQCSCPAENQAGGFVVH